MSYLDELEYSDDRALVESMPDDEKSRFAQWMVQLESENKATGQHYTPPLSQSTGVTCWYDYFSDGYSAKEAMLDDLSHSDQDQ